MWWEKVLNHQQSVVAQIVGLPFDAPVDVDAAAGIHEPRRDGSKRLDAECVQDLAVDGLVSG
jgi:hypothetical protein